jgi:alpha-tubulin suppressor-like RCC1 family protein
LADTGELWAWGIKNDAVAPIGHGEETDCALPKPIESLQGIKVDAVVAGRLLDHTLLALADDGCVYAWGSAASAVQGAFGLGGAVCEAGEAGEDVPLPERILGLRVACGL